MRHHHHDHHSRHYVPAAGHDWALPLYDHFIRLFRLDAVRAITLAGAELRPGQRVLDVGCGTGTLICELKRRVPALDVSGVDPDAKALAITREKVAGSGGSVRLEEAFADSLPFPDHNFDHVFSSFMFHHLGPDEKRAMLHEVRRVLVPGGHFHLIDFRDEPHKQSRVMRLLHAFSMDKAITGQREAEVEALITMAGFSNVQLEVRRVFAFGAVASCHAQAPGVH